MMSSSKDDAETAPSDVEPPTEDRAHTDKGAPTDEAHQDAGNGSLTGSPNCRRTHGAGKQQ